MTGGRRQAWVVAAVATVAVLTTACGDDTAQPAASTGVPSGTGGKLTIGISFDEPGIGLRSGDGYAGFDVDTAVYVAKALGVPREGITWKQADPASRETLLTTGQVDLVVATYSITDERKQKVAFAGPYFVAHQDLLVRRNDDTITGPDTLDGKNLCSVTGTTSAARVKAEYKGRIKLVEYGKYSDCVRALVAGDIDAVTTDDLILAGYAALPANRGILRLVGKGFSDERYGVGIAKGDTELVAKVTQALRSYISDGSWKRALEATVRPSGYEIPDPPTPGEP